MSRPGQPFIQLTDEVARSLARELDRVTIDFLANALASHLARARILTSDLTRDVNHARILSRDLDRDRAHRIARNLTVALARAQAEVIASPLVRDFDLVRNLADDLAGVLVSDPADISVDDLGLPLIRSRSRDLVRDLTLALAFPRARVRGRARDLVCALASANKSAKILDAVASCGPTATGEQRKTVRVAPAAGRLLGAAARLLPAASRARYIGEFGSELWELAAAGAGRRAQLAYAARQARSALVLRTALRTAQRRRALP
jgi:hypothetical protein